MSSPHVHLLECIIHCVMGFVIDDLVCGLPPIVWPCNGNSWVSTCNSTCAGRRWLVNDGLADTHTWPTHMHTVTACGRTKYYVKKKNRASLVLTIILLVLRTAQYHIRSQLLAPPPPLSPMLCASRSLLEQVWLCCCQGEPLPSCLPL